MRAFDSVLPRRPRLLEQFDGGCAFSRIASNMTLAAVVCSGGAALASGASGSGTGGGFSGAALPSCCGAPEADLSPCADLSPPAEKGGAGENGGSFSVVGGS